MAHQRKVAQVGGVDRQAGGDELGAGQLVGAAGRVAHREGRGPGPAGLDVDGRGGGAAEVGAVDRDLRAAAGTVQHHTGDAVVERDGADAAGRDQPVVVRVGGGTVVRDPAAVGPIDDVAGPGVLVEEEERPAV